MERLLFTLVLALTAWVIQRLAGGNRRQLAKVPEGMAILCQPPEAFVLKYPLRREQELPWSSIQKMEVVLERKQGKAIWKKLRLYTKQGVYKLNMGALTSGRDGFLTELYKIIEKYEIPLIEAKR